MMRPARSSLKQLAVLALLLLALGALLAVGPVNDLAGDSGAMALTGSGFAVLELFTSEGCSSCPPADELLAKLAQEHARDPVYALSFHVDYWDDLGWKDAFSDRAFSERQAAYVRALKVDGAYTPQLVVNGRAQAVGSRAFAVRVLLDRALGRPPDAPPAIELHARVRDGAIEVRHQVAHAPAGTALQLLLVQRSATSRVARGENASRTLHHVGVVRSLARASANGTTALEPPRDLALDNAEVVALLQDTRTLAIVAAARATTSR